MRLHFSFCVCRRCKSINPFIDHQSINHSVNRSINHNLSYRLRQKTQLLDVRRWHCGKGWQDENDWHDDTSYVAEATSAYSGCKHWQVNVWGKIARILVKFRRVYEFQCPTCGTVRGRVSAPPSGSKPTWISSKADPMRINMNIPFQFSTPPMRSQTSMGRLTRIWNYIR